MTAEPPLLDRLRRTLTERHVVLLGARVLVAVSGGPDSLSLLHALCALRDELCVQLVAGHLNHRMRPAESDLDAQFVQETAAAWGVPAEIGARDVATFARRTGLSLEEAGREARYRFFARAARRQGCNTIATAHTADDQAETVLLHLFRGTGLDGLAGIPFQRPLRRDQTSPLVIRPFLEISRAEVVDYCQANGLRPRTDTTNESMSFLRNRVRRQLLPLLEADYSPAVRIHLLRLSRLAEDETALLDAQARVLLEEARCDHGPRPPGRTEIGRETCLSRVALNSAPQALTRRALRLCLQELLPGPPPEWALADRLLALLAGQIPGFPLPGGQFVARVTDRDLILETRPPAAPFLGVEATMMVIPGITSLPWTPGSITTRLLATEEATGQTLAAALPSLPPDQAVIDRDRVAGTLSVRPPRPGDRIQPLGMRGHRKLQDLLTDRKVAPAARRRLPVVCDEEKLLWVAGHCISDTVRVTPDTRSALWLVWTQESGSGLHRG